MEIIITESQLPIIVLFGKKLTINEDENPLSGPQKTTVSSSDVKSLDMNSIMKRNPFLEKIIPQKENFLNKPDRVPRELFLGLQDGARCARRG